MIDNLEWTEPARNRWDRFLEAKVWADGLDAEDGADLRENLTLHLEEELAEENREAVTLARIDRAIGGLGGDPPIQSASIDNETRLQRLNRGAATGFMITFGVLFPILVFGLELMTGFCGSIFFDPLTTWWHVALIAIVVGSNWWLLSFQSSFAPLKWRGLFSGISTAVSAFYALLFVPLIPLSCFALIALGMGLLSLTPVLNFLATWGISRKHREIGNQAWSLWWKRGLLGTVFVLFLMQAPGVWTRIGLQRALSEKVEVAERGMAQLRLFHSDKTLLRACYEGNRGTSMATDISGWIMDGWQMALPMMWDQPFRDFNSEAVRSVYYRVTGDAFNSKEPPGFVTKGSILGGGRDQNWSEMQWDDHLGGEEVAVRLANLDLIQSRIDGHLDSSSGLAYQEWTMVFRNDATSGAQEARMQMLLPEDGVVSRVTLWVNGEPREAAFASKSKVRAAYQAVAVKQRRDPVLVTATGPGRVLVQCFPVPADGGEMKIRIGMTAPLKSGRVATPFLLERNFGIAPEMETSVWMQAPKEFSYQGEKKSHHDGSGQSLQLKFPALGIQQEGGFFKSNFAPQPVVWCQDPFAEAGQERLIRGLIAKDRPALSQCIIVVDGSESMKSFAGAIQKAVTGIADFQERVTVVIADDGVSRIDPLKHRYSGGRDNGPALEWALRKAREQENSAVVWLHGPQPLGSAHEESLAQLLERGTKEVPLYSVAFKPGGNRLLEKLFQYRSVRMGPRLSKGTADLGPWLERLVNGGPTMVAEWKREGLNSDPGLVNGKQVWDQLARWWATEQVRTAERQQSAGEESVAFAAKYQLVTAFSGAVVLETAEQYKEHGLEPVDPSTTPEVPATPEPGTWLLMLFSAFYALTRRRRNV